jgi:hypothetical protein
VSGFRAGKKRGRQGYFFLLDNSSNDEYIVKNKAGLKLDDLVKSQMSRHPGESRGPDVVPTEVGSHLKDWIPVFTGNPGFRLSPE